MIECRDVSFSYPASGLPDSEKQAEGALKHISCTIEDGSFVLLCGTSGCGKTTMTRLFNGLIPHYHEGTYTGSVYLDGKDTRDLSLFDISLKVGSVFQNPRSQFFNVDTTSELAKSVLYFKIRVLSFLMWTRPANWLSARRTTAWLKILCANG